MILNFIMGFVFGLTFALILLLIVAWRTAQENKGNNSSTSDWDKGEYNGDVEYSDDKKKD
jgi:hypothetical protein